MSEQLMTGEFGERGYEYPLVCPLNICQGSPPSTTLRNGRWECDECGKVVIYWNKEETDQ